MGTFGVQIVRTCWYQTAVRWGWRCSNRLDVVCQLQTKPQRIVRWLPQPSGIPCHWFLASRSCPNCHKVRSTMDPAAGDRRLCLELCLLWYILCHICWMLWYKTIYSGTTYIKYRAHNRPAEWSIFELRMMEIDVAVSNPTLAKHNRKILWVKL